MLSSTALKSPRQFYTREYGIILFFALAKLCVHLSVNAFSAYGYIRDELYYLACTDHLAWGYVDHPPFSIAVLWISRVTLGDSLFAIRVLSAVSGALTIALTGLLTKQLGGSTFAQVLSCCCALSAPLLLGMDSIYSMNSFDILFWTLALYLVVLCLKNDNGHWVYLGMVLGIGLLNKISVLWLCAGLVAGLALTPDRKLLLTRKPWAAGAIALVIFAPHVVWQFVSGFPTLEFIRNAASGKYVSLTPVDMIVQQSLLMNPITFPIWCGGLIYFLVSKRAQPFRILPIVYLTVLLILLVNKDSKATYLGPLMPMLFAIGAVSAEQFLRHSRFRWLRITVISATLVSGAVLAPFVVAIFPVQTYITYAQRLGVSPLSSEKNKLGRLPQHFADMFGWPEMVGVVAEAYNTLTPQEKSKCAILCSNYGEAGAVDFFGRRYGLPRALSGHNSYWLWGPGTATGEVVIRVGASAEALRESYDNVVQAGTIRNSYSMPYESDLPVWICRNRRAPLKDDWAKFKVFR